MPELPAAERVLVPFSGQQTGAAPLTWGQRAVWQDMQTADRSMCLAEVSTPPAGATAEYIMTRFADLVGRHPALRTRLEPGAPDGPRQVVHACGQVAVDIVAMPDDATAGDVEQYASRLHHAQEAARMDPYRDWPVQLAVITHRGAVAYRVFTVSRLVVDSIALGMLRHDLNAAGPPGRADAMSLLDLARREQTEPLRRVSDRAMRYWERQLRSAPPQAFGEPADPQDRPGHRYRYGVLSSPAAGLAMLAIAQRTGTDTARVLHAVIATAIARATGSSPLTTKITVSNRFRPGYSQIIGPLSQDSVATLDLAHASIDAVIAQAGRAILAAGVYGYYDPRQLDEVRARVAAERGHPAGITWVINDTRTARLDDFAGTAATGPATGEQIARKRPETVLAWEEKALGFAVPAQISVFDHPGTLWAEAILETSLFPRAQADALLRGIEEVAVEAALDPSARAAPGHAPATVDG
jgi:Condensation domain